MILISFRKMNDLRDKMLAVAKDVARQFGDVIGCEVEYFVGDDPTDMVCFGDCYFFSVGEMLDVVSDLDKYVKRYGSKDAVGQEIRDWVDWWSLPPTPPKGEGSFIDSFTDIPELVMARVTHQARVNISLKQWLDGAPREDRQPWSGPDADVLRLENDVRTTERLVHDFGHDSTLGVVLQDLNRDLDQAREEKARRDFEDWQRVMKTNAGQQFKKLINKETI